MHLLPRLALVGIVVATAGAIARAECLPGWTEVTETNGTKHEPICVANYNTPAIPWTKYTTALADELEAARDRVSDEVGSREPTLLEIWDALEFPDIATIRTRLGIADIITGHVGQALFISENLVPYICYGYNLPGQTGSGGEEPAKAFVAMRELADSYFGALAQQASAYESKVKQLGSSKLTAKLKFSAILQHKLRDAVDGVAKKAKQYRASGGNLAHPQHTESVCVNRVLGLYDKQPDVFAKNAIDYYAYKGTSDAPCGDCMKVLTAYDLWYRKTIYRSSLDQLLKAGLATITAVVLEAPLLVQELEKLAK